MSDMARARELALGGGDREEGEVGEEEVGKGGGG